MEGLFVTGVRRPTTTVATPSTAFLLSHRAGGRCWWLPRAEPPQVRQRPKHGRREAGPGSEAQRCQHAAIDEPCCRFGSGFALVGSAAHDPVKPDGVKRKHNLKYRRESLNQYKKSNFKIRSS